MNPERKEDGEKRGSVHGSRERRRIERGRERLTSNSGNRDELDEPSDLEDSDGQDDESTDESELSSDDLGGPFPGVGCENCGRGRRRKEEVQISHRSFPFLPAISTELTISDDPPSLETHHSNRTDGH